MPDAAMARERALAREAGRLGGRASRPSGAPPGAALLVEQPGRADLRRSTARHLHRHRQGRPASSCARRPGRRARLQDRRGAHRRSRWSAGFSPQLTLTAAILERGGFAELGPRRRPASWSMCASPAAARAGRGDRPRRRPAESRGRGRAGAGGPEAPRRPLRRPGHALRLLGRAAVHRPVRRRLRPPGAGVGMARDRRGRGARAANDRRSTPAEPAGRPGGLRLRHRQRRVGQDLDPGQPGGAAAAARAPSREAILCVTYTKAAAAEMQRRLFETLGGWAVMDDAALRDWRAGEDSARPAGDLSGARALFAQALETPGGLKIQTIHAFCEKLLRRFPLEAGVVARLPRAGGRRGRRGRRAAREAWRELALARPDGEVGRAYAHFAVAAGLRRLRGPVRAFERERRGHRRLCRRPAAGRTARRRTSGAPAASTRRPTPEALRGRGDGRLRLGALARGRRGAARHGHGQPTRSCAARLRRPMRATIRAALRRLPGRCSPPPSGEARQRLGQDPGLQAAERQRDWLLAGAGAAARRLRAARRPRASPRDTVHALTLAQAYVGAYEGEKARARRAGLPRPDRAARTAC